MCKNFWVCDTFEKGKYLRGYWSDGGPQYFKGKMCSVTFSSCNEVELTLNPLHLAGLGFVWESTAPLTIIPPFLLTTDLNAKRLFCCEGKFLAKDSIKEEMEKIKSAYRIVKIDGAPAFLILKRRWALSSGVYHHGKLLALHKIQIEREKKRFEVFADEDRELLGSMEII